MDVTREHEDIIEGFRKQRALERDRMYTLTLEIEGLLNSLAMDEGDPLIRWADFEDIEIGIPFHITKDVYFVKYLETKDTLGFKTFLKAGATFGIQKHDCLEELLVLQGDLIDIANGKSYTLGETALFKPCQLHKPGCTVDSVYKVLFTRSKYNNCK